MIYLKNEGASIAMNSTENESSTSMAIEETKILDAFWSYQQNSTANLARLTQNWAKLAKSAVPFSWLLQNGTKDLFFALGAEYLSY